MGKESRNHAQYHVNLKYMLALGVALLQSKLINSTLHQSLVLGLHSNMINKSKTYSIFRNIVQNDTVKQK